MCVCVETVFQDNYSITAWLGGVEQFLKAAVWLHPKITELLGWGGDRSFHKFIVQSETYILTIKRAFLNPPSSMQLKNLNVTHTTLCNSCYLMKLILGQFDTRTI